MTSRTKQYVAAVALAIAIAGCAGKPPQYQTISSSANPTTEIERTEEMLRDAQGRQVDVLSPKNFADARKALEKAKDKKEKGKSNEDILEQVSYSRGWLNEANAKAEIAETSMKDITDARAGALRAGAPSLYPKEWKKAGDELEDITAAIEKGNLSPSEKKGNDLTARYRDLETMSVTKANLGIADENIKSAKKDKADKNAPKSWDLAIMKYNNAEKMIKADPRNTEAIRRASEDATRESVHLLDVTRRVNAGNTEDLVLMADRQQRTISSLRNEYSSTEKELQESQSQLSEAEKQKQELAKKQEELEKIQTLNQTAADLRKQFKPNEAEVYTDNGKLMIRLRGLQFASNQATLGPKNQALLKKVETALNDVEASHVRIEGHTDATGNPDRNTVLSEERAKAVENFLVKNGAIPEDRVDAVGMGSDKPISDNKTQRGRAENRRIDLVIETE
nr:OmpA family protein [uncultured Bdellovibrio sp.]